MKNVNLLYFLSNLQKIQLGACVLTILGNIVTFLTILGFFIAFDSDDDGYMNW